MRLDAEGPKAREQLFRAARSRVKFPKKEPDEKATKLREEAGAQVGWAGWNVLSCVQVNVSS